MGYLKIILVGLVWVLCVLTSVKCWYKLIVVLAAICIPHTPLRKYASRLWTADDQDIFVLVGGKNEDVTISHYVGVKARTGDKEALQAKQLVNAIFFWQDDHCEWAIEKAELKASSR